MDKGVGKRGRKNTLVIVICIFGPHSRVLRNYSWKDRGNYGGMGVAKPAR